MMKLLIPLGLLGLLGIAVLLLIYLIRPNYQQKVVSSTFVWKLSLKYRKKKLPTSKLRNIILIICQILIITACSLILSKPAQVFEADVDQKEVIAILDSSASMRTLDGDVSRYEKAIDEVKNLSDEVFRENGVFSVIIADRTSSFLVERASSEKKADLEDALNELVDDDKCSYAKADVDASIALCEDILIENPSTEIYLFTDTTYAYHKGVNVKNVAEDDEWNAAILDAYTEFNDNYYDIIVEVACYGRDQEIELNISATDINPVVTTQSDGKEVVTYDTVSFKHSVACYGDQVQKVVFKYQLNGEMDSDTCEYVELGEAYKIYSYKSIVITLNEYDSYDLDDTFAIYGGEKETVKIQYYSSSPNTFVNAALYVLASNFADRYDIRLTEVKDDGKAEIAYEGYDIYIFEHKMPDKLPTDGVVYLFDPDTAPNKAGFTVAGVQDLSKKSVDLFADDPENPIMRNIDANNITISRFTKLSYVDETYHTLMSYDSQPMLMYKNEATAKIVVMNFSVHYSNIALTIDFPVLMANMFRYFFPTTVEKNAYDVYDTVDVNSRGEQVIVSFGERSFTINSLPAQFIVTEPNTYVITQTTDFGETIYESIYVRIPKYESNIHSFEDSLAEPYKAEAKSDYYNDLMFYVAIALVALVFFEWWLKNRESM